MNQPRQTSVRERSHYLRERSKRLRSDGSQLREDANKVLGLVASLMSGHSALPARAVTKPSSDGPAMPLPSMTFDRVRKAREQAKAVRARASDLRKQAEVFRFLARQTRGAGAQTAQSA